jgi:hypothetical protein
MPLLLRVGSFYLFEDDYAILLYLNELEASELPETDKAAIWEWA